MFTPQREERFVEAQPRFVLSTLETQPVELASLECIRMIGIGDEILRGAGELGKAAELATATLRHERRQLRLEIAEEEKRRRGAELFAHEEHWNRGRKKPGGRGCSQALWLRERNESVAER